MTERELQDLLLCFHEAKLDRYLPLIATIYEGDEIVGCAVGGIGSQKDGTQIPYVEHVIIRPKFRGSLRRLRDLKAAWDAECRVRGFRQWVTRIEKTRPNVAQLGQRFFGYIFYKEDEHFLWFYSNISR